ncbi:hypothetical protein ACFWSF_22805 [Streptomyces sp. NPDC058611]|uniref:hypothetical protein n=1 Tax=unclassified Streptomyces TaxID=2593676 RepID=UPI00365E61EC
MPAHHAVHALAATAATAAAVLAARWWTTRARRPSGHGASAARAPWRRTAPAPDPARVGHQRVAELHAALLEPRDDPGFRATDAELDRYWKNIAPFYP